MYPRSRGEKLFSVANAVDAGNYVLFGSKDVKFLWNLSSLEANVIYTSKRLKISLSFQLLLIPMYEK